MTRVGLLRVLGIMNGRSGAAAFDPTSITGLKLWLDGSDLTTLFQDTAGTTPATATNDPVARWNDKSGTGNNTTQATAGAQASLQLAVRNGLSVVRFGGNDFLKSGTFTALAQPNTVFAVGVRTTAGYVLDGQSTARHQLRINNAFWDIWAGAGLLGNGYTTTNWAVFTAVYNGASSVTRTNSAGATAGNAGSNSLTQFTIGSGGSGSDNFLTGDIAEILFYNALLTEAQMLQVETYLNNKWAVF